MRRILILSLSKDEIVSHLQHRARRASPFDGAQGEALLKERGKPVLKQREAR